MQLSKRSKGKEKQDVIFIPKEVVIEILRRVPGQDLAEKLKMVCMLWCSIIYSGRFAYSHIEHKIKSSSFSQLEAVVISMDDDDQHSVRVSSLEWHSSYDQNHHQFRDWKTKHLYTAKDVLLGQKFFPWMRMMRVNSVNGFVCFSSQFDHARFHVFNPVAKEYLTTPKNIYLGLRDIPITVGFGFCPLSYEYKVVVLNDTNLKETKPSVFTIGTDHSWRPLKEIPLCFSDVQTVAYVKGALYWYAQIYNYTDRHKIDEIKTKTLICFDVTKEEFDTIVVPIESPKNCVTSVVEKGGRLCLIVISSVPICSLLINVCVANNNIDDDLSGLNSWKKELTVTAPSIAYALNLERVYPIVVTDEIVVIGINKDHGEDFAFFDVASGKLLGIFPMTDGATSMPYMPSLVAFPHRPLLTFSS